MPDVDAAIPIVRDSVCAVMRVRRTEKKPKKKKHGPKAPATQEIEVQVSFVGTAWCVVESKVLVTAHHVLNNAQPRQPDDKFYILSVPGNGDQAYHFPVVGFPLEDPSTDAAILEI